MNAWLHNSGLLAQYSKWQRLGDGLRRSRGRMDFADMLPYILGLAVLAIGIAIAAAIVKRNDMSQPCNDPKKLFRELCRAHGLDFSSRRLLHQLASAYQLHQPAEVFLTPSAFQADRLPPQLQAQAGRLQQLHDRLF